MLLTSGRSVTDVARQCNCHRNTNINLLQQSRNVRDGVPLCRPNVTTARQDRYIALTHVRDRFKTALLTARKFGISRQTVLNRLSKNENSFRDGWSQAGQIINPRIPNLRRLWAQRHLRWTRVQLVRELFSDESCFNLSVADGIVHVFRGRGKRFVDNCLLERDRFGGGSVGRDNR